MSHNTTCLLTCKPEKKVNTFGNTIGNMKDKPQVEKLTDNLRPAQVKKKLDALGDVMTYSLVKTTAETLQKAKAKTHLDTFKTRDTETHVSRHLMGARRHNICVTSRNVNRMTLVDTLADTIKEAKAEILSHT